MTEFESENSDCGMRPTMGYDSRFKMQDLSTPEEWEELTDYSKRKGLLRQTIRQPG